MRECAYLLSFFGRGRWFSLSLSLSLSRRCHCHCFAQCTIQKHCVTLRTWESRCHCLAQCTIHKHCVTLRIWEMGGWRLEGAHLSSYWKSLPGNLDEERVDRMEGCLSLLTYLGGVIDYIQLIARVARY
jgi:hypothetical protein